MSYGTALRPLMYGGGGGVAGKFRRALWGASTFAEVIEHMFERCSVGEVEVQVEVARRIWFRRNTVVHGGDFLHPNVVVLAASMFIDEYRKAMERSMGR